VSAAQAPFTGTWRSVDPLAGLRTAPVDGTWTFTAYDLALFDSGTLRSVSLHVNGYVAG